MGFSLNKTMLIGNLGQNAESRFTTSNLEVCSFSIATSHSYKGKDGNYVNETTWHNCVMFSPSDYLKKILVKGNKIYLEGRISKRDYENKDGIKVYVTELIVDNRSVIDLSGERRESSGSNNNQAQSNEDFNQSNQEDDDLPF